MKRLKSLLPFVLLSASTVHAAGVGSLFRYSFVSPNLYCLNFGYYDAAHALGITGFDLNPAGLARMNMVSFGTAFSTSKRADARIDLEILPDSFYFGKVIVPVGLGFEEAGGWDFLGAGSKVGPFAFGFGFRRGELVGVQAAIDTEVIQHWDKTIPFVISHSLFPEIPAALGNIPVNIAISGDGDFNFTINGNGAISYFPITFGAALDLGVTSFGLGGTVNIYKGSASIAGEGEGTFTNVAGSITQGTWPIPLPWKVAITIHGSAEEDSLYFENFDGDLTGTQFVLRMGNQTRITNLILGELVLGGVIEEAFPTTFGSGFTNRLIYASGMPRTIIFDTTNYTLNVDYVNMRITGDVSVYLSDFAKTIINDSTAYPFKLSPQTNLYFAGVYKLYNWDFNLGGGVVGFIPPGQGWGRIYFDGGVRWHQFITWNFGVLAAWQRYQVASYKVTTPPIVVVGLGGEAKFFGVGLDFGVRTNTTSAILAAISASRNVSLQKFNLLNWMSFGIGLKYDL